MFTHYQEGDIKDGEDSFAQGAGDIPPVKADPRPVKLLHEQQPGLLGGLRRKTGGEQREHEEQTAGQEPKGGRQGGEPHRLSAASVEDENKPVKGSHTLCSVI